MKYRDCQTIAKWCREGQTHLAFHAESHQQVDFTKKLRARGFMILYEDKHPQLLTKNWQIKKVLFN
ncbi:hypothetical protein GC098_37020 [Paenibacillus sp. LMG 31458]|uniref:Uncharacterized protein n=1 Tax=Paenibacillus phytorum TaxID=2654977 RepID=A0ABX1Y7I8_9BACL|nr:hypothetical protein [Paenibacillus phytorum]